MDSKAIQISAIQFSEVPQCTTYTMYVLEKKCENILSFTVNITKRPLLVNASACCTPVLNGLNSMSVVSSPFLPRQFL